MPKKIICAGMNRSGSTMIYNVIRCIITEKYGSSSIYTCIIDDYDCSRSEEWHLLKAHDANSVRNVEHDFLITSYRDLRAVTGSFLRMGWLLERDDQINATLDNYVKNFHYFSQHSDLCLKYEEFCRQPGEIVKNILSVLGMSRDIEFEDRVLAKLISLRPLANAPTGDISSADADTMLHHGHIGGIDNHAARELLSNATCEAIEIRYVTWLLSNGYDVPTKSILARLSDLEGKIGPSGDLAVPVLRENAAIVCDRNVPSNLLHYGFEAEDWGAWSVGEIASLRFGTPPGFEKGSVQLSVGALTPPGTPPLIAEVFLNGHFIDTWYWRGSLDQVAHTIQIGPSADHDLTFRLSGARSPAAIGLGPDQRRLGLALREICLRP